MINNDINGLNYLRKFYENSVKNNQYKENIVDEIDDYIIPFNRMVLFDNKAYYLCDFDEMLKNSFKNMEDDFSSNISMLFKNIGNN